MPYHYPAPEQPSTPESPWAGLSDEARESLTGQTLQSSAATRVLASEADTSAASEASISIENKAETARRRLSDLLDITDHNFHSPKIFSRELNHIQWERLEKAYVAMRDAGLKPEVVVAPEGRTIEFWQGLFNQLRKWQNAKVSAPVNRLKSDEDGNTLCYEPRIKQYWRNFVPSSPGWGVSVIPATSTETPFLGTNHSGNTKDGVVPLKLSRLLNLLPTPSPGDTALNHPSIERYLTLQATSILYGLGMPEAGDNQRSHHYCWLDGSFDTQIGHSEAPYGYWYSNEGLVCLGTDRSNTSSSLFGVRPEVRG